MHSKSIINIISRVTHSVYYLDYRRNFNYFFACNILKHEMSKVLLQFYWFEDEE